MLVMEKEQEDQKGPTTLFGNIIGQNSQNKGKAGKKAVKIKIKKKEEPVKTEPL